MQAPIHPSFNINLVLLLPCIMPLLFLQLRLLFLLSLVSTGLPFCVVLDTFIVGLCLGFPRHNVCWDRGRIGTICPALVYGLECDSFALSKTTVGVALEAFTITVQFQVVEMGQTCHACANHKVLNWSESPNLSAADACTFLECLRKSVSICEILTIISQDEETKFWYNICIRHVLCLRSLILFHVPPG